MYVKHEVYKPLPIRNWYRSYDTCKKVSFLLANDKKTLMRLVIYNTIDVMQEKGASR